MFRQNSNNIKRFEEKTRGGFPGKKIMRKTVMKGPWSWRRNDENQRRVLIACKVRERKQEQNNSRVGGRVRAQRARPRA